MKNLIKISLFATLAATVLVGCNCFKSASKNADQLKVTTTQSPVSLKGDIVPINAEVVFPAKFMTAKSTYKITPVFIYEGGEVVGASSFFQGEDVKDNFAIISSDGGVAKVDAEIEYVDEIRNSILVMRIEVKCDEKSQFIPLIDLKASKGVSILQTLTKDPKVVFMADNFKRVTNMSKDANIMFNVNSAYVASNQLNSDEVKALQQFIVENENDSRKTVSDVYTKSYASPEGPVSFNDKLSELRGKSTNKAMSKSFKKNKVNPTMDIDALGEDWDGFKKLVEESDIVEKDMILQILSMYNDPAKRNKEIQNMSSVFTVLEKTILPKLRRSQMSVNVEVQGYTDEELKAIVAEDVAKLNLEEMLFAATLYNDMPTKAMIYEAAIAKYPTCSRALNNLGVVSFKSGNIAMAKELFVKASEINSNSPEIINNLAAIAIVENDLDEAKKYLQAICDVLPHAKSNLGLVFIKMGNYTEAIKHGAGFNKAIAQILLGDYAGAKQSIKGGCCAKGLVAVIAAKEGDFDTADKIASEIKDSEEIEMEIYLLK